MRRLLPLLLLLAPFVARAQTVEVVASDPADHAVSVPLTATVTFTFSAPLAEPPAVFFSPAELIEVGEPVLSPDGLSVSYAVEHQPETAYVHLVLDATGADGEPLARPFALNYTTAASGGSFTVSGEVEGTPDPDGTVVALFTADLETGDIQFASATVLDSPDPDYAVGPVPFGIYFAGAVQLPYGERPFAYGFYDPDGDGLPNPVVVPFNVDIVLAAPAPVPAGARVDEAVGAALGEAPDNELVLIPTTPVDTLGTAALWTFGFYSPAQATETLVLATGLLPFPFTRDAPDGPAGDAPVPVPFVDSDLAVQAAEDAGGRAFRALHAAEVVLLTIRGGLLDDFPADDPFWRIDYRALDGEGGPGLDSLGVFVDMATGLVLGTTTTSGEPIRPAPSQARLGLPQPNPFARRVGLDLTLDEPSAVRVAVYDLLGREVAVLADGTEAAGPTRLTWTPGRSLAAGVYVLRLQIGGRVEARRLVYRP